MIVIMKNVFLVIMVVLMVGCSKGEDVSTTTTPTISFTIPLKYIGDKPFLLTSPIITSNSAGVFMFTSSNTSVATISGNTVTILSVGTTEITVTQVAFGSFIEHSEKAVLVVENPKPITDIDGNVYETIVIGNQTWMKTNLNVSNYKDGTPIPEVTDPAEWATLTTGAWCYYDNDPEKGKLYGKLYNWYAVNDKRGLAPTGTSIPTDAEWTTLTNFIGSEAGGKMKESDTSNWTSPNSEATNSTGFTGLPGGICISNGDFHFIGDYGYWWSATSVDAATAWNRSLGYNSSIACRSYDDKNYGFAVRCIKK